MKMSKYVKYVEIWNILSIRETLRTGRKATFSCSNKHVNSLSGNISDCFPEPKFLSASAWFHANYSYSNRDERESDGVDQIKEILERFGSVVGEAYKVLNDWPSFVGHMATTALKDCKDPVNLWSIVCRDPSFHTRFPETRIDCSSVLNFKHSVLAQP